MARLRTAPLVVAMIGALYLLATAARDLQPFDSAEFALNAVQFGVGHPPGQPLYLLLSAAAVRALPFISPSFALALISILALVFTGAWATSFGVRSQPELPVSRVAPVSVFVGGCAVYLLPGVWDMGTRAEVYPLAALCIAGATFLLLGKASIRSLGVAGLLLGLGASVNPAIAVSAGVALLPVVAVNIARLGWRAGAMFIGAGIAGLLPYLILPILGAHPREALVWGEPLSGPALTHFLLGRDYRAWQISGNELIHNLGAALGWLLAQGILPWLVLGTIGLLSTSLSLAAKAALPLGALCSTLLLALNHPFIPTNPDYDGYLLPWIFLSLAGVTSLVARFARRPRGLALSSAMLALLMFTGALAGPPLASRDRRRSHTVRALATWMMRSASPQSLLLGESDHLVFGTLYLQLVEGQRRDLTLLNAGWANSSWYWRWLLRRDPKLPSPYLDAPTREARLGAFIAESHRGLAAERLRMAALGGQPACLRGGLYVSDNDSCASDSEAVEAVVAELRRLLDGPERALPGSLDERLVATTALALAEDHLRSGHDADAAFRILAAGLRHDLQIGLRADPPPPGTRPEVRTPLVEPRALVPPGALLLRLGDLLAHFDAPAAAECYRRADLPEADAALRRLASGPDRPASLDHHAVDLAPQAD